MATKSTKSAKPRKPRVTRKPKTATRTPRTQSAPKPSKPVFRMGTWITLLVLAAVVGTAIYMNRKAEEEAKAEPTPTGEEQVFVFGKDRQVNSIEVKPADGDPVQVERNQENTWMLSKPDNVTADQGLAEAAASQVAALTVITEIDSKDLSIFGLDNPKSTLTVKFDDGTTSTVDVGDSTPTGTGYYIRVDSDKIYVVEPNGIDSLLGLAVLPPYLHTPTPSPTATSTPLPTETPEATLTP